MCATNSQEYNRQAGVFILALREVFSFSENWHEDPRANPIVRQYQVELETVVAAHPRLQACVVRCVHCQIRFLTHPRNATRIDLRCPFGCRDQHRKTSSNQRTAAYRATPSGARKKKQLNLNRPRRSQPVAVAQQADSPVGESVVEIRVENGSDKPEDLAFEEDLCLEGHTLRRSSLTNSSLLPYVRMIVKLVDNIDLRLEELVSQLSATLRQHSIGPVPLRTYIGRVPDRHPP